MTSSGSAETRRARQGMLLKTRFFPLDWTLRFTHPTVTIDGDAHDVPWGERYFELAPGRHELEVSYPYLHRTAGRASVVLDVRPEQVVEAAYRTPRSVVIAFRPGTLTVSPPPRTGAR